MAAVDGFGWPITAPVFGLLVLYGTARLSASACQSTSSAMLISTHTSSLLRTEGMDFILPLSTSNCGMGSPPMWVAMGRSPACQPGRKAKAPKDDLTWGLPVLVDGAVSPTSASNHSPTGTPSPCRRGSRAPNFCGPPSPQTGTKRGKSSPGRSFLTRNSLYPVTVFSGSGFCRALKDTSGFRGFPGSPNSIRS